MKVYRFIFAVGFLNLFVLFLGIPFLYKNYALITLAGITIVYALILRAIEKEKTHLELAHAQSQESKQKTIEQVVDMIDESTIVMDIKPSKRGRKKLVITQNTYE
jgi:CTP synthase (UTP-ammonia lyase)